MTPLHDLARAAGLLIDWEDASGEPQRIHDDVLATVLAALGLPAGSAAEIAESRRRLREEEANPPISFLVTEVGQEVQVPAGLLTLEQGGERTVAAGPLAIGEPGYHRLESGGGAITIAVAPRQAFQVHDAAPGRRIWAPAVQIPSLRDRRGEPYGDFGALARFAEAAGREGAGALAISPVHALFPADPSRFSPYAPSTRLFLNIFLADPSLLGAAALGRAAGDLIDWQSAIPERMRTLRSLYEARSQETREEVEAFRLAGGEELELHSRYDALHAHFFGTGHGGGWQAWPPEYRDPHGSAVAAFAREHAEEVGFYLFLQWLADRSLAAAQAAAKKAGMAVGLIADLAIGMDAGGSHGWARSGDLLSGLSIGAPPDKLGPDGQDWGITSFSPRALRRTGYRDFIATIRAALRHAGGIRIDHALGLRRLWVVPHGAAATEGAYLTYPEADMMRLLALESWRARAIVVGEDLGTVPPGFREAMGAHGFLGMRVLWFERGRGGSFKAPEAWPRKAAALTGTHDLPTVAGWWRGRDIDWTWRLGRTSGSDSPEAEHEARGKDRERLWKVFRKTGVTDVRRPPASKPGAAVDAAIEYVASTPCELAIVPAEDLLGQTEQPNLPGTTNEHPNWRRRLPADAEDMFDAPDVRARVDRLNQARRR